MFLIFFVVLGFFSVLIVLLCFIVAGICKKNVMACGVLQTATYVGYLIGNK